MILLIQLSGVIALNVTRAHATVICCYWFVSPHITTAHSLTLCLILALEFELSSNILLLYVDIYFIRKNK